MKKGLETQITLWKIILYNRILQSIKKFSNLIIDKSSRTADVICLFHACHNERLLTEKQKTRTCDTKTYISPEPFLVRIVEEGNLIQRSLRSFPSIVTLSPFG